jgi:hypothetical protein
MRATILDDMPPSGDYPERSYEPTLECVWVLFEPGSTDAWVGAFGPGSFGCRQVLRCGETQVFLVLAGGAPYLVNAEDGELVLSQTGADIMTALQVPDRDLIIAADYLSMFAFSSRGLAWESSVVAIEGVDLLEVTSNELRGRLHTEGGTRGFYLRCEDWQLREGGTPAARQE